MKVIVINGHAESGKSTFIQMCSEYPGAEVQEVSMVDAAKHMASTIGWKESMKTPRDRKFLSDLKDLIDEYNEGSYFFVREYLHNYAYLHDLSKQHIVFIHAREPEDIKRLVKDFNAKTLVIRRKFIEDEPSSNHADANWWNFTYDFAVNNNGELEHLKQNSEEFMKYILKEDFGYEQDDEDNLWFDNVTL